jgi:hypothetical protein
MTGPSTDNALAEYPRRLQALETRMDRVDYRFDLIEGRLARIEATIDRIVVELAELRGRVSQLPTTWQFVTWVAGLNIGLVIGVSGLVYAIARTAGAG